MVALLVILYVLVCLFLIVVVLFQQGKGADLAGAFGGAGTATQFGPRSRTNYLHWVTTGSFVAFVVLSMSLAIIQGNQRGSVLDDVQPAAEESDAPAEIVPAEQGDEGTGEPATSSAPEQPAEQPIEEPAAEPIEPPAQAGAPPTEDAAPTGEPATNEPTADDSSADDGGR